MSEQANQLHNPPIMFNERKITFYIFLHSCDRHVMFVCVCVCVGVIRISIIIVSCGFGGKTIHSGAEIMQP